MSLRACDRHGVFGELGADAQGFLVVERAVLEDSYRDFVDEKERGYNLGFRCARSKG